jgi:D-arabinose 1-dehydrogenase-like Zn-dependent alcohol dehydrogenase
VYSRYGAAPVLTQAPDPACPADGVVIAVGATGVCRSDWHAWKGHEPVALPHIGGHEFAGVVMTAGPEVRRWRAGDRVTVPFACGCGRCEHCLAGDYPAMLGMVVDGTLRPGLLVGEVIELGQVGRALAAMDEPGPGAGMTVVSPAG